MSDVKLTDAAEVRAAEIRAANRFHIRGIATMIFLTYWMVILTYPTFFFVNPLSQTNSYREIAVWLCLIGWNLAALVTPALLFAAAGGSRRALAFVPVTALWWPVSIVLSQVTSYLVSGVGYASYILHYPIFVITDIAIPLFVLWQWSRLRQAVTEAETRSRH
jgi:hypothetical protein